MLEYTEIVRAKATYRHDPRRSIARGAINSNSNTKGQRFPWACFLAGILIPGAGGGVARARQQPALLGALLLCSADHVVERVARRPATPQLPDTVFYLSRHSQK